MLVDSSVWVAFLRGDPVPEVSLLVASLERKDVIWIAPPALPLDALTGPSWLA